MRSTSIIAALRRPWEIITAARESRSSEIGRRRILCHPDGSFLNDRTAVWLLEHDDIRRTILAVRSGRPGKFTIWAETRELEDGEVLDLWRNLSAQPPCLLDRLIYLSSR